MPKCSFVCAELGRLWPLNCMYIHIVFRKCYLLGIAISFVFVRAAIFRRIGLDSIDHFLDNYLFCNLEHSVCCIDGPRLKNANGISSSSSSYVYD